MAAMIAGFPAEAARHLYGLTSPEVGRLPTYHHLRGLLLEGLGRDQEARESYEQALKLDPRQVDSTINLALVLERQGEAAKGLALLDLLLERHPRAEGALRNRALLRYAIGDVGGLAADLQAAQAILPSSAVARSLASYYEQHGPRELWRHWLEEARRLAPHEEH
jgi:tetratricopeptide (TPR) repeat protein